MVNEGDLNIMRTFLRLVLHYSTKVCEIFQDEIAFAECMNEQIEVTSSLPRELVEIYLQGWTLGLGIFT